MGDLSDADRSYMIAPQRLAFMVPRNWRGLFLVQRLPRKAADP